jgi:hypothetical protein
MRRTPTTTDIAGVRVPVSGAQRGSNRRDGIGVVLVTVALLLAATCVASADPLGRPHAGALDRGGAHALVGTAASAAPSPAEGQPASGVSMRPR